MDLFLDLILDFEGPVFHINGFAPAVARSALRPRLHRQPAFSACADSTRERKTSRSHSWRFAREVSFTVLVEARTVSLSFEVDSDANEARRPLMRCHDGKTLPFKVLIRCHKLKAHVRR